jgi:hypothetical protein
MRDCDVRKHLHDCKVLGNESGSYLDQNQPELGVLVVTVALEVLPNGDSLWCNALSSPSRRSWMSLQTTHLLDQLVQVLGDLWCQS